MTRACDHLILPLFRAKRTDNDYQKWLADYIKKSAILKDDPAKSFRIEHVTAESIAPQEDQPESGLDFQQITSVRDSLIERHADAIGHLAEKSPKFIRPSAYEHERRDEESEPSRNDDRPLRIGRALHQYMALTPPSDLIDEPLLKIVCEEEDVAGDEVRGLVGNVLHSVQWRAAIAAEKTLREVPVLAKTPEGVVRGVVDLVWFEEGVVKIADYKSGEIGRPEQIVQLMLYAEAIEKSIGKPVSRGWLISARDGSVMDVLKR